MLSSRERRLGDRMVLGVGCRDHDQIDVGRASSAATSGSTGTPGQSACTFCRWELATARQNQTRNGRQHWGMKGLAGEAIADEADADR
jgi:hypothetical protein